MNWAKGFTAQYYMTIVDPITWRDTEKIKITGGKVDKSKDSELMESAQIECRDFPEKTEKWIRVWMDTKQEGSGEHVAIFTGLASAPKISVVNRRRQTPLECYSVLLPADVPLQRGWYAPTQIPGAKLCRQLLEVSPAPVSIEEGSPALQQAIVAESGETRLSMTMKILDAIGWRIRIEGNGQIEIIPQPTSPAAVFGASNDVIETTFDIEPDWFDCPNVFQAVCDDLMAIARDDDPDSVYSVPSRGREVWMIESDCDLGDSESIEGYAVRRLKEEQKRSTKRSYYRRFDPAVSAGDMVRLHYPAHGLQGDYITTSISIEIGGGARTSEVVEGWI